VALADAGSRIRVALRNPKDEETAPRHSLTLAAVFSGGAKPDTNAPESTHSPKAGVWDHPVQLHVRVFSVNDAALEELRTHSAEVGSDAAWRVTAFHSSDEAAKLLRGLEQKHELEPVSGQRLMAGVGRPISYRVGAKASPLRVKFSPEWLATGKLTLRVNPGIGASTGPETQLPEASSFLLESRETDPSGQNSPGRLFPGRSWEHKRLVVFVSARAIQQTSPESVARTDRGR